MPYPGGLTSLLRYDGAQPAYSDLAQAVPAVAPLGRVRSIPQPSPLSGSWIAPSDAERPTRVSADSIACEPLALDYPTHVGQYLIAPAPASAISANSCTIACSFRSFTGYGGSQNALIANGGAFGLVLVGNGIALAYNGGTQWDTGIRLGKDLGGSNLSGDSGVGNLICIVAQWSPTGLSIYVDEEGTVYNPSPLVATINPSTPGSMSLGYTGNGYGNIIARHADVIDGHDPAIVASLIAYLKADGAAAMFPATQPLVAVIADSIGVPAGPPIPTAWDYRMLANLRAVYPDVQLLNTSIGGSGIAPLTGNFSTQTKTVLAHLSGARAKQVAILTQGTNTIVSDPSNSGVDAGIAMQFALADALRAAGSKVLIAELLTRGPVLLGTTTQLQFDNARARWNAALNASGLAHCDGIVRLSAVVGMGADGDWANSNYTADQTHPSASGHALLEPAYTAAVLALTTPYNGKPLFQMQARSSATSRLYTWTAAAPDRAGLGYVAAGYPGTPLEIVVSS